MMFLRCTLCDVELPNPGNFPYTSFLQVLVHNLGLDLQYPENLAYSQKFPDPIKVSILKSAYFFESSNI